MDARAVEAAEKAKARRAVRILYLCMAVFIAVPVALYFWLR